MDKFSMPYPIFDKPDPNQTEENLKNYNHKDFEKSEAYKKYIEPMLGQEKREKAEKRKTWWKDNSIALISLLLTFLTLIATILFGVIQLQN